MKTKLTIAMLMLATVVRAQFSYVNLTTLHTNTQIITGYATVPGVFTNQPFYFTNYNYYTLGDSSPTSWGKANGDFAFIANWMGTNPIGVSGLVMTNTGSTYISIDGSTLILNTNGFGGGSGGGGGVTNLVPTNGVSIVIGGTLFLNTNYASGSYLLKSFGAGNDLTISNTFTITSTNVTGYTLTSVTVSGYSNACFNGTFTYNAQLGALSNSCGYLFSGVNESGASVGEIYVLPFGELFQLVSSNFFSAITNVGDYFNTASYNLALSRWEFVGTSSSYFYTNGNPAYTVDAPAVPVNGSSHALYAGGNPALAVGTPIVAYFFLDPATIGNMLTCTFATIQTNLSWVILQPNDTQQADGTYTNYTIAATGAGSNMGTPSTNFFMGVWTCVGQEYQMQSGVGSYGVAGPHGWGSGGCAGVQILDMVFIYCPPQLPCATPTHKAPSSPVVEPAP